MNWELVSMFESAAASLDSVQDYVVDIEASLLLLSQSESTNAARVSIKACLFSAWHSHLDCSAVLHLWDDDLDISGLEQVADSIT
jgi:hypothetical protein